MPLSFPQGTSGTQARIATVIVGRRPLEPGHWVEIVALDRATMVRRVTAINELTNVLTFDADVSTFRTASEPAVRRLVTYLTQPFYPDPEFGGAHSSPPGFDKVLMWSGMECDILVYLDRDGWVIGREGVGVAGEEERELLVASPGGQLLDGVGADGDEDDVAAGVEGLSVLIPVRSHLDRSTASSRAEEEGEHDGLALEVAEPHGFAEHAEAGGAGQLEVGRDGADLERRRRRRLGLLCARG